MFYFLFENYLHLFNFLNISNAGKGKGLDGERSGLIWKLLDIIKTTHNHQQF